MWLSDVREHADPNLTCILVANKVDLCPGDGEEGPNTPPTSVKGGKPFFLVHPLQSLIHVVDL